MFTTEAQLESVGRFANGALRLRGWKGLAVKIAVIVFVLALFGVVGFSLISSMRA